ncbi:MAG: short chain dehydrogenase [Rhizobiaceae bacterium]
MKVLIIGATGDVGSAICRELADRHELIRVGRKSGDLQVNAYDPGSVQRLYRKVGTIDAVVSAVGIVRYRPLDKHTSASMFFGLQRKVMGQINLVVYGRNNVSAGGSFTLTSGVLDVEPTREGVAASTANGALAGFIRGAAIEMDRDVRINAVGPGLLDVSAAQYGAMFPTQIPVDSEKVGQAYANCVEGTFTGKVVRVT